MREPSNIVNSKSPSEKRRVFLIAVFCLIAILQSGLRDISKLPAYNDTPVYQAKYDQLRVTTWGSVFSDFSLISTDYSVRDSGYEVFMKLTQILVKNFVFFMFLTAIIFIIPFGMLVNKYVKSYFGIILSFVFYFSIFTNIVNCFMRQAIALGIVLFTTRYIIQRNWKKYFIFILIAFTIHSSSIVALPLYFLPKLCSSRKWLLISFALSPILLLFQSTLLRFLLTGTVYENYVNATVMNPVNYILLLIAISVLALIYYKIIMNVNNIEILLAGVMGTLLLMPLVFMGNTMLRISYYYVIFLIPLLPVIIDNVKIHRIIRMIVYIFACCFFLLFIIR